MKHPRKHVLSSFCGNVLHPPKSTSNVIFSIKPFLKPHPPPVWVSFEPLLYFHVLWKSVFCSCSDSLFTHWPLGVRSTSDWGTAFFLIFTFYGKANLTKTGSNSNNNNCDCWATLMGVSEHSNHPFFLRSPSHAVFGPKRAHFSLSSRLLKCFQSTWLCPQHASSGISLPGSCHFIALANTSLLDQKEIQRCQPLCYFLSLKN